MIAHSAPSSGACATASAPVYPRFKARRRYRCIELSEARRPFFRGEKLYVDLVFAEELAALEPAGRSAGIDLGVNSRVALSDGTLVEGRTPDRRRERRLRNRNAAHELTTALVRRYDRLAVEELRTPNMTRSARGTLAEPGRNVRAKQALNRRILDHTWGLLIAQLTCKAAWAGRELVAVDPAYTSRICSACGAHTPQARYRIHECGSCGSLLDRDVNAARNVLARAFGEVAAAA